MLGHQRRTHRRPRHILTRLKHRANGLGSRRSTYNNRSTRQLLSLLLVQANRRLLYSRPACHCIRRNRIHVRAVDVVHICDVDLVDVCDRARVVDEGVVVVHNRHIFDYRDIHVRDVHRANVIRRAVIPRHVRLSNSKREPCRHTASTADIDSNRDAARASYERHECR